MRLERSVAAGAPVHATFHRLGLALASTGSAFDIEGVLNPGVARDRRGRLLLYPRMVAAGNVSRIGLIRADETESGPRSEPPRFSSSRKRTTSFATFPGGYGCEDPRVTFVPQLDAYVMAYTAFGPHGPRIALALSPDGYSWSRLGLLHFADDALNHVPNKDAAFFPEPVLSPSGIPSFALYHRPMLEASLNGQAPIALIRSLPPEEREVTCIAYVPVADVIRDVAALRRPAESVRVLPVDASWGALKNGAGTPPVTNQRRLALRFPRRRCASRAPAGRPCTIEPGIVVHDLERPDRLVYRSPEPLIDPETPEERVGIVNDVVFPTGIDLRGDGEYDIYYGAADARIARARIEIAFA